MTPRYFAWMFGVLFLAASTLAEQGPDHWPQFRGPGGRGVADGSGLPDRWSASENIAWKTDLPGLGWSSPVVWGQKVFVTTVVKLGQREEPRKGLYFGGERPQPQEAHEWKVYCLDLETGRVLWDRVLHKAVPQSAIHLKNSYASETPVVDADRVYVMFGNLGVFCFDHDGKELWRHALKPHPTRYGWGTAASPALHDGRLYIVNDNESESHLLVLNAADGQQVLRVERPDEKSNWSPPFIWETDKGVQVVTAGTQKVRAYDTDGKLLWWLEGMSSITIAQPYTAHGLLYVTSGYIGDRTRPIYAIQPGAAGRITLDRSQNTGQSIAWCRWDIAPYNPTTLTYGDRLYVLLDRGILACYDAKTGNTIFEPTRIPEGRAFTASPWASDGKIYCINENGVTFVLKDAPTFELLGVNPLGEDDMTLATPAVAAGRLLIRTAGRIYCIKNP